MEDILKRVYKIIEVRDNVWEELQKRDLVIVKLIAIERFSKRRLNFIPYESFLYYVGLVNVELIKYNNWNFFAILPPVNNILKEKFKLGKFAMYTEVRDPTDRMHIDRKVFVPVDEKDVLRARGDVVP
ncbi:hypothetical protein [Saccharolobus islandicus]|uniref:hypothetical protein n=1 Tax=Saccharolobus islandicus TaxID=43080 RepID=UPI00037B7CE8|nr:hypothetical protein [Sulfolobus islandicus]